MKAEDLKNSILQLAMEGKLVPQNPNDEPASVLLEKIRDEKERLIKAKKIKRNNKESFIFRKNGHFYERIGKKGEPICIDDEIQFDVPDTWELCRLENLCSLLNPKIEEKSKYPYLNAKFLRNKIDPEIKEKGRFVEKNTKVILVDGENSGEVFLTHTDGYMGSTFRILYINSEMYDEYVLKLLELWKNPLKKSKKGAAIPHLNKDIFNKILVGIPPINEQKRIIDEINHIYPLIKEYDFNKEKLDKLNSEFPNKLRSSILQEAIQGKLVPQNPNDEPASILLEKIREEKKRLIKEKKIKRNKNESYIFKENNHFYEKIGKEVVPIDNELPFEIPNSWEWVRLGDIVYNFGQKKPDKTFSYIDVGSIDNKNLKLNFEENILTKDQAPSRARKIVKEGCIIYSTVRPYLLNMCIINKKFLYEPIASTAFAILNPFTGVCNKYLFYYLQSPIFINYVNKVMSGVAYPAINDKKLYNSIISLPPLKEQIRIIEKIDSLFEKLNF